MFDSLSDLHGIELFADGPQVDEELLPSLRHAGDGYELLKERPAQGHPAITWSEQFVAPSLFSHLDSR